MKSDREGGGRGNGAIRKGRKPEGVPSPAGTVGRDHQGSGGRKKKPKGSCETWRSNTGEAEGTGGGPVARRLTKGPSAHHLRGVTPDAPVEGTRTKGSGDICWNLVARGDWREIHGAGTKKKAKKCKRCRGGRRNKAGVQASIHLVRTGRLQVGLNCQFEMPKRRATQKRGLPRKAFGLLKLEKKKKGGERKPKGGGFFVGSREGRRGRGKTLSNLREHDGAVVQEMELGLFRLRNDLARGGGEGERNRKGYCLIGVWGRVGAEWGMGRRIS